MVGNVTGDSRISSYLPALVDSVSGAIRSSESADVPHRRAVVDKRVGRIVVPVQVGSIGPSRNPTICAHAETSARCSSERAEIRDHVPRNSVDGSRDAESNYREAQPSRDTGVICFSRTDLHGAVALGMKCGTQGLSFLGHAMQRRTCEFEISNLLLDFIMPSIGRHR